jgi:hypothetical protein
LFQLNETTGTGAHGNNVFIHSQLLVTDQIRAIVHAFAEPTDCRFSKLAETYFKRMAASVMFQNRLFENAQIIMESAREICSPGKYNSNCKHTNKQHRCCNEIRLQKNLRGLLSIAKRSV